METTIGATGPLGPLGALATPARKTRRRSKVQPEAGEISINNQQSISTQVVAVDPGTSYEYARGASVEVLGDVELVAMVLAGTQDAFAILVERYKDAVQNLAYRM